MSDYRRNLSEFLWENSQEITMLSGRSVIFDPHQSETLADISNILDIGDDRCAVVHGGWAGKTVIAAAMLQASQIVKDSIFGIDEDRKDVILVTERAILNSVHEKLQDYGFDVGIWWAGGKNLDRKVIIWNISSLQRADNIWKELPIERTDLLIWDEADLYLTDKRKKVVWSFINAFKVWLTATPEWNDGRHISELWWPVVNHFPMWKSLESGVSVPPIYKLFESQNEGSGIGLSYGKYNQRSLEKAFIEAEIDRAIPQIYSSLIPKWKEKEYPTLVYVPWVDLVHSTLAELRKALGDRWLTIEAWTWGMTTNDDIVRDSLRMQWGELDILVLCKMWWRWFDVPRARCLIDASPTLSRTELEQRHSRITRKVRPGTLSSKGSFDKPFCIIAQVIPSSYPRPPILFPDLLEWWTDLDGYKELMDVSRLEVLAEVERIENLSAARADVRKNFAACKITLLDEQDIREKVNGFSQFQSASEDGFIEIEGEKYATLSYWSLVFKVAIRSLRIKLKNVTPTKGFIRGTLRDFYWEYDTRELCGDIIERQYLHQANDEDILIVEEQEYRPFNFWVKQLWTSHRSLKLRVATTQWVRWITRRGEISYFYRQEDIDGLGYVANKKWEVYVGEELYMSISDWARFYRVSTQFITSRIDTNTYILARTTQWLETKFYPKTLIESIFSNEAYQNTPKANKQWFFIKDSILYRTKFWWMSEFWFANAVGNTIFDQSQGIVWIIRGEERQVFYTEQIARGFCKELFEKQNLPQSDKSWFFEKSWITYGTKWAWGKRYKVKSRLEKITFDWRQSINWKDARWVRRKFFPESYIREIIPDAFD